MFDLLIAFLIGLSVGIFVGAILIGMCITKDMDIEEIDELLQEEIKRRK